MSFIGSLGPTIMQPMQSTASLSPFKIALGVTSLINLARVHTDSQLKQWFSESQLDYLYGAATFLALGTAGYYAQLSLKVNFLASLFFTVMQMGVQKFAAPYHRRNVHDSSFASDGKMEKEEETNFPLILQQFGHAGPSSRGSNRVHHDHQTLRVEEKVGGEWRSLPSASSQSAQIEPLAYIDSITSEWGFRTIHCTYLLNPEKPNDYLVGKAALNDPEKDRNPNVKSYHLKPQDSSDQDSSNQEIATLFKRIYEEHQAIHINDSTFSAGSLHVRLYGGSENLAESKMFIFIMGVKHLEEREADQFFIFFYSLFSLIISPALNLFSQKER